MNVVRTVFRIKPKNGNRSSKNKDLENFKNEFYIASNEFSKQKVYIYTNILLNF